MNITINDSQLEEAVTSSATKAIGDALGGWEVRNAISGIVTKQIAEDVVVKAVEEAVRSVDHTALVAALSSEIQKATTKVVVGILREGLVEVVCKLRGIGTYGDDVQKRKMVAVELFKE